MQLLSLRTVNSYPKDCACCGRMYVYTISVKDNSTQSLADYCFGCYHSLTDIFILEENH